MLMNWNDTMPNCGSIALFASGIGQCAQKMSSVASATGVFESRYNMQLKTRAVRAEGASE
jgi:hypothetical protein